ncbi:MAG: hypothetical protein ACYTFI_08680 [Planctomycetota bacterium]
MHGPDGWYPNNAKRHRWLVRTGDSSIFFWYSGRSLSNARGALMAYIYTENVNTAWYASFHRPNEWRVLKCKAVSPHEIECFL